MSNTIWVLDIKIKRPWLNISNGELVNQLKKLSPVWKIEHHHQIDENSEDVVNGIIENDIVIIYIDHYSLKRSKRIVNELIKKNAKVRCILYGVGILIATWLRYLPDSVVTIPNSNSQQVANVVAKYLGLKQQNSMNKSCVVNADYSSLKIDRIFNYPTRTSKGCLHKCPFCSIIFDGKLISKDKLVFEREIRFARERYNIRSLTLWDSMFNFSTAHVKEVCRIISKFNIPWRANGLTVRNLTEESIHVLSESGCFLVSLGIESFAERVNTGKYLKYEDVLEKVVSLQQNGIKVVGFFIIGLENDTYEKSLINIEIAKKVGFDITLFSNAIAYPGTRLFEYVKDNGIILKPLYEFTPDDNVVHFETECFSKQERLEILDLAITSFNEKNKSTKSILQTKIGGPYSPSDNRNITWE